MTTEQTATDPALEAAFADTVTVLARDGYAAAWELDGEGAVTFRVAATADACAECLVPAPVMQAILDSALEGTGYRIGRVELPADH
ncbi:hypothetical protein ACFP2T_45690 [Plantactinospora solaniradicis]|uniref:NifU family protein n=1 Tax=Plantactinospora solaniradicis TaxID=1723736 RepID=A0ABW1KRI0_9ACTN